MLHSVTPNLVPARDVPNLNWSGKVFLWQDQALFIGRASETSLHSSPGIKICISLEGVFGLRTNARAPWQSFCSAMIAPGQIHAIDGRGKQIALLIIAPEARMAQPLAPIYTRQSISELKPGIVQEMFSLFGNFNQADGIEIDPFSICQQMLKSIRKPLVPIVDSESILDPRVSRTVELLREETERAFSIGEIAAHVDLSESRFSHLFSDQLRVSPRRYLLWLRLREALQLLSGGASVTYAAHGAGFADSAHLARTFRGMLGISATSLIRQSSIISGGEITAATGASCNSMRR